MRKEAYERFPLQTKYLSSTAALPVIIHTVPAGELWYVTEFEVFQDVKPPQYFPLYRKCRVDIAVQKPFSFFLILSKAINNAYVYKDSKILVAGSGVKVRPGETITLTQVAGESGGVDNYLTFLVSYHLKKIDEKGGDY